MLLSFRVFIVVPVGFAVGMEGVVLLFIGVMILTTEGLEVLKVGLHNVIGVFDYWI